MAIDLLKYMIWKNGTGGGGKSYEKTVGPAPIISISDAKPKPAKSLIVGMEPIQDLHGYDNPWPAGGGKNKFDVSKMVDTSGITINNGVISVTGNARNSTKKLSELADLAVGDAYILAANTTGTENIIYLYGTGANVSWTFGTSKTITQEMLDALVFFYGGENTTSQISNFMIRLASVTDATYAPYENLCPITGRTGVTVYHSGADTSDPQTYPVVFPDSAGTVYGGTVDAVTGVLTVDRATLLLDGTQNEIIANWRPRTNSIGWYYNFNGMNIDISSPASAVTTAISDALKAVSYNDIYSNDICSLAVINASGYQRVCCRITDPTLTTKELVNAYLSQHPITVCYVLATPQTYQLTPTQIQMLKGANVLWSDADDLTLTYLGTTPENLLGGMLGGGLGGAQEPIEETSEEPEAEPVSEEPQE